MGYKGKGKVEVYEIRETARVRVVSRESFSGSHPTSKRFLNIFLYKNGWAMSLNRFRNGDGHIFLGILTLTNLMLLI